MNRYDRNREIIDETKCDYSGLDTYQKLLQSLVRRGEKIPREILNVMEFKERDSDSDSSAFSTSHFPNNNSSSNDSLLKLDFSFTYPNCEEDRQSVLQSLSRSLGRFSLVDDDDDDEPPFDERMKEAVKKLDAMIIIQQVFDGHLSDAVVETILYKSYSYEGWEKDLDSARQLFLERHDDKVKEVLKIIDFKERLYSRAQNIPLLSKLRSVTFTYPDSDLDLRDVEKTLVQFNPQCFTETLEGNLQKVTTMLDGMFRMQQVYDRKVKHRGIEKIQHCEYNYENSSYDMKIVRGKLIHMEDDTALHILERMDFKQRVHDGDRSHPVLVRLDSLHFTYPNCDKDAKMVEDALTKVYRFFGDLPKASDCKEKAYSIILGMVRMQQVYDGKLDHPCIKALQNLPDVSDTLTDIWIARQDLLEFNDAKAKSYLEDICYNFEESNTKIDTGNNINEEDSSQQQQQACVICAEHAKNFVFVPCGHVCLCENCATSPFYSNLHEPIHSCPVCRRGNCTIMKIYV